MTEPGTSPLLAVNNLEVVFHHSVQVLKGLSLAVPEGRIVALLGSNGAGKTTTLEAIAGLLPLDDGEITDGSITFRGAPLEGLLPHQIARSGLLLVREGRHVFEDLTVEENLACATYARAPGRRTLPRAGGRGPAPVRGGLADDLEKVFAYFPPLAQRRGQKGGYLSGGEQQMLAIGRALVARPSLMLLDEPSLGLSPRLVEEIFEIILRINREEGTTILLVEQNAHVALQVASHGYIMEGGKVVLDGPVDRLRKDQDVQEFYLGRRGGHRKSYREVKHYKRRKRWLS